LTENPTGDQLNQNDNHSEEAQSSVDSKGQLSYQEGSNADDQSNTTTSNVENSDEILVGDQNSVEGKKQQKLLILKLEGDLIDNKLHCIIVLNEKKNLSCLVCMPGFGNTIHSGTIMVKYFWEHDHQRVLNSTDKIDCYLCLRDKE